MLLSGAVVDDLIKHDGGNDAHAVRDVTPEVNE